MKCLLELNVETLKVVLKISNLGLNQKSNKLKVKVMVKPFVVILCVYHFPDRNDDNSHQFFRLWIPCNRTPDSK